MSSITSPPAKIHLASTTKISLNDRFAKLAKVKSQQEAVQHQQQPAAVISQPHAKPQVRLRNPDASHRNKELAMTMASRPSVRAALQSKNKSITHQQQQQQQQHHQARANSARQNNTNTASLINNSLSNTTATQLLLLQQQQAQLEYQIQQQQQQLRGFDQTRLSMNGRLFNAKTAMASRLSSARQGGQPQRGGKLFRADSAPGVGNLNQRLRRVGANNGNFRGTAVYVRGGGGIRRGGFNRGGGNAGLNTSGRVTKRTSFGNRSLTARGGSARGNARGGRGGARGGFKNGRGCAVANGVKQEPKSKENLDMDLDQYMSKSRSHLDADLDGYMAQAQQPPQQQDKPPQ
jgi:hypothetical protein